MAASPADRLDGLFKLRKAYGWLLCKEQTNENALAQHNFEWICWKIATIE